MNLTYVSPKRPNRVYVRKFDHDEARQRYAAGEAIAALALEFGVHANAVRRVVDDGYRKAQDLSHKKVAASGRCDRCGGHMNGLSRYHGSRRCASCFHDANATNVRPAELRCVTCREWKPDDEFPSNRAGRVRHRGRHHQCRTCQTTARREYRHRNREKENAYGREYRARRRAEARAAVQPTAEEVGQPPTRAEASA